MSEQAQEYPRVADYIASVPWLIEDGYLDLIKSRVDGSLTVEQVAQNKELAEELRRERENSPAAVAARAGTRIEKTSRAMMREGGVAILPVIGPIFRYANLFTRYSGATSTAILSTDFNALLENPDVQSVLLSVDSPGGEAFGIPALAEMIMLGSQRKPVVAFISGMGASAAYWLAAAASEIWMDSIAIAGSIGVVLTVRDMKRAERQRGIDSYEIVSTQSPRKRLDPSSEEGRVSLQETADAMCDEFIGSIARYRGVAVETVLSDFGQGGVMVGRHAVDAGLADRIGSFESLLAEMAGGRRKARRMRVNATTQPATGKNLGGEKMSLKQKLAAWLSEQPDEEKDQSAQTQTLVIKTEPAAAAQTAGQTAQPAAESDEVKRLRAENEELKKAKVEQRKATLQTEAEAFINAKIQACEVLPAVKDGFVAAYVQAGLDDDAHPVAEGQQSRVAMLKGQYEGREKHQLTGRAVKAPEGAKVLEEDADSEAMTPKRRAKLLSHTGAGRAAAKSIKE